MSAATFAASAALAPASTSAASSLNRISVPRAPLSARFLRPSLLSVSPSRRRSAAATTCSKRSRRAARGIVVSPDGAGALASSLLGLVLDSLLCLSLCPACWRFRAFGRTEVRRAASRGQLRGGAGLRARGSRAPRALRALRALWVFLMQCGGLLSLAPSSFWHRHWAAVKGEHSTLARPHQNANYQTHAQHSAPPRMCGGNLFAPVESNLSKKKTASPQKRAPPHSTLGLDHIMMPQHAPLAVSPRARAPRRGPAAVL